MLHQLRHYGNGTSPLAGACSILTPHYQPFDANDPRNIQALQGRLLETPASSLQLRAYDVKYLNAAGLIVHQDLQAVEFRPIPDVAESLPFYRDPSNASLMLGYCEQNRPVLALRKQLGAPAIFPEEDTGRLISQVGAYVDPSKFESGITQTLQDALILKGGAPQLIDPLRIEILGVGVPRPDSSPEVTFLRALEIVPPQKSEIVYYGKDFEACRIMRYAPAQDLLRRAIGGDVHDIRLVEAAARLQELEGEKLILSPAIREQFAHSGTKQNISDLQRILASQESVAQLLRNPALDENGISFLDRKQLDVIPSNLILRTARAEVANLNLAGQAEDRYECDLVYQQGVDAVGITCFFRDGDKLYVLPNIGTRVALAERNSIAHPLHADTSERSLEGIYAALSGEERTLADVQKLALATAHKYSGMQTIGEPIYLNYYYPSAGYNPGRIYGYLVEVDPNSFDGEIMRDALTKVLAVEVDDFLELAKRGVNRDLLATWSTRVLKAALNYQRASAGARLEVAAEERREFEALIDSPSRLQSFILSVAPELHSVLSRFPAYRNLLAYFEQEQGIRFEDFAAQGRAGFFNPLVRSFPSASEMDRREFFMLLFHDLFHYCMGDFIPVKAGSDQKITSASYDTYWRSVMSNEAEAIYYSDVVLAKSLGLDLAREISGKVSIAEILQDSGITDADAQRQAIRMMVIEGIVPAQILQNDRIEEFRPIICDKLLGYFIRDRENTQKVYQQWISYPKVALLACEFCKFASNDEEKYAEIYSSALQRALDFPSQGSNPLKAALAETAHTTIPDIAIKLAYALSLLEEQGSKVPAKIQSQAADILDNLKLEQQAVLEQLNKVELLALNEENLTAFRIYKAGLVEIAAAHKLLDGMLEQPGLFQPEQAAELKTPYPFFRQTSFGKSGAQVEEIDRLFESQLAAASPRRQ